MSFGEYYSTYYCHHCGKMYCFSAWLVFSTREYICSCGFSVFKHGNTQEVQLAMSTERQRRNSRNWHITVTCDCCHCTFDVQSDQLKCILGRDHKGIWLFSCEQCSTSQVTIGKVLSIDFSLPSFSDGGVRNCSVLDIDLGRYSDFLPHELPYALKPDVAPLLGYSPGEVVSGNPPEPPLPDPTLLRQRIEHENIAAAAGAMPDQVDFSRLTKPGGWKALREDRLS